MRMHKKRDEGTAILKCPKPNCQSSFDNQWKFDFHLRIHDNDLENCQYCPFRYTFENHYAAHLRKHFGITDYKCDQCGRFFSKRYKLKNHIEMTHEKKHIFNCDLCDKSYNCISNLNKHKRTTHERIKKFKCEPCNKSYAEKFGLECHMKSKAHLKKMNSNL